MTMADSRKDESAEKVAFLFNCDRDREGVALRLRWMFAGFVGNLCFRRYPKETNDETYLNLGFQHTKHAGFVNADYYLLNRLFRSDRPDWMVDITRDWKCRDNHWDGIFCSHVIEHIIYADALHAFGEMYRTLKSGKTLRIVVPDAKKCVDFYNGMSREHFARWQFGAVALSNLAQNYGHVSVWDADLLLFVLDYVGFTDVKEVGYLSGRTKQLLIDNPKSVDESVYVEATKP